VNGRKQGESTQPTTKRFARLRTRRPVSPNRLNLRFLRRTVRLAKPYWFSEEMKLAWGLLALLVALLVGYTWFSVLFNSQSGEFTSALAARDGARFWKSIRIFFILLVIGVPIDAYYYFVVDKLSLHWRRWLTDRFVSRYLDSRQYYKLLGKPDIDNPDQRIADDIYSFTKQSLGFILVFANALFQLVAFGSVLWSISNKLVLFLFAYAAILTITTFRIFGEKMVFLHFIQRGREADFRFGLVRLRENAESIALYRGEREEKKRLQSVFTKVFANYMRIIRWSLGLNFFYYGNNYIVMVLPTLIIAPRVLSGQLEVGRIVEATGAFSAILGALSILLDNLEDLSTFAASVGRLETLSAAFVSSKAAADAPRIQVQESDDLQFHDVTLHTPAGERTLIENLNATVKTGDGLMIVGASGLGKSSLLRAVAGLWDSGEGTIVRPKPDDILFLPQYPYMAIGNLRVQLSYPNLSRKVSDEDLQEVLEAVNLGDLAERCGGFDNEFDFEKVLSVGERQRLAFARVLLNHPKYVLLDEATSALDRENEAMLYEALAKTDTTVVSISHHPSLVEFHSNVLEFQQGGKWKLHTAKKFRFSETMV
jgi:putative ATP-binding cassette transporter